MIPKSKKLPISWNLNGKTTHLKYEMTNGFSTMMEVIMLTSFNDSMDDKQEVMICNDTSQIYTTIVDII